MLESPPGQLPSSSTSLFSNRGAKQALSDVFSKCAQGLINGRGPSRAEGDIVRTSSGEEGRGSMMGKLGTQQSSLTWGHLEDCLPPEPQPLTIFPHSMPIIQLGWSRFLARGLNQNKPTPYVCHSIVERSKKQVDESLARAMIAMILGKFLWVNSQVGLILCLKECKECQVPCPFKWNGAQNAS